MDNKKVEQAILNELKAWDLSCSEEPTLKTELAKALTKVLSRLTESKIRNKCSLFKIVEGFFVCERCGKQYKKLPADDMQCSIITVKTESPTFPPDRHTGNQSM